MKRLCDNPSCNTTATRIEQERGFIFWWCDKHAPDDAREIKQRGAPKIEEDKTLW
jgi:hypothetical protein